MKKIKNDIEKIMDSFSLDVKDDGRYYRIIFTHKKTGDVVNVPVIGDILNFRDIVEFSDGTTPAELTKQDWINLYLKLLKNLKR